MLHLFVILCSKMSTKKKNLVKGHFALYDTKSYRSRCKLSGCNRFSHLFCEECEVHLCITSKRNCFYKYHHNNQPKANDTVRKIEPIKDTRQTIETTNVNVKRSSRASSVLIEPKKECRQIKQVKVVNHEQKKQSARNRMCTVTRTSTNEKHPCRRSNESPKAQQNQQIKLNHGQKAQSGHFTRSKMRAECPIKLIVAKGVASKKEGFMSLIGLVSKK